jgi:putative flippase GtrA
MNGSAPDPFAETASSDYQTPQSDSQVPSSNTQRAKFNAKPTPQHTRTLRSVALFLVVGAASAGVDFGIFWVLNRIGWLPWVASAISFSCAFAVNYLGNRDLVFRAGRVPGALIRYCILVAFNLATSTATVASLTCLGMNPAWAKLTSMVLVAGINFVALRLWVFH